MSNDRGTLSRLLGDPIRVRRPASVAGLCLSVLSGASYLLLDAGWLALAYGLTWLALPVVAAILGYGKAFFIEHGVGARRALLEGILGLLAAMLGCALLATITRDNSATGAGVLMALLAGLLYFGIFRALANGIALGLGRGMDYAGRRMQELDDEGW